MNRRSFLATAGATAASVATGGLGTSRRLFAQSAAPDVTTLNNAINAHCVFTANAWNGFADPTALKHLANTQENVRANLLSLGIDDQIKSTFAGVDPSSVDMSRIDMSQFVASVQQYAPSFQMEGAQQMLQMAGCVNNQDGVAAAVQYLQQNGITPGITQTAVGYGLLAQEFTSGNVSNIPSPWKGRPRLAVGTPDSGKPHPLIYHTGENSARLQRMQWGRPIPQPLSRIDPTTGYSCAADSMAGLAFGTTLATLAFMCYFTIIGAPICTVAFLFWAGTASAGWGLGHAIKCNF